MLAWELWFAIIPGVILFLYGIENFSKEIQRVAGGRFRSLLAGMTKNPAKGAILGAVVTAIIQSSTATTVIVVSLVNAGTIPFAQSLGIMIGANVGTTMTAQLIAFKLTGFAPYLILSGFLISLIGGKYRFIGKPVFYFGLVFFSLSLVSDAVSSIGNDPDVIGLFSQFSNVFIAILAGLLFTIILQSSSVTSGIVILLAGSGILSLGQSIPIILGANIGTTATSLIAASRMDLFARRASMAHLLFNLGGVAIFLPFLVPFASFIEGFGGGAAQQVANAHLVFNLVCAIIFLLAVRPFKAAVERLVPGKEEEILFRTKYLGDSLPGTSRDALKLVEKELKNSLGHTTALFGESSAFMKGNPVQGPRIIKLEALIDYLDERIENALLDLSKRKLTRKEAAKIVLLVRMSNVTEQLGDRGKILGSLASSMEENGARFSPESKIELERIYGKFRENLLTVSKSMPRIGEESIARMRSTDNRLRQMINESYDNHLKRLYLRKAYAGSYFVEMVSLIEDANAQVREIRKLCELFSKSMLQYNELDK